MRARIVAEPHEERDRPDDADDAEELEGAAPRHQVEHIRDDERRERAAPARREPQDALGAIALTLGQPDREDARQVGKASSFAGAEEGLRGDERRRVPRRPDSRREERPPQDDAHQHAPGPDAIAEPASRNLEQGVREHEGGDRPAHLHFRQLEIFLDGRRRLRNADAVEILDHGQRHREGHDPVAGARRRRGSHRRKYCHSFRDRRNQRKGPRAHVPERAPVGRLPGRESGRLS